MARTFCIGGPTATGKSQWAPDVPHRIDAEIANADTLQTHPGLDLLTAYLWKISPGLVYTPRKIGISAYPSWN